VKGRPEIVSLLDSRGGTGRTQGAAGPMLLGHATSDTGAEAAQMHVMIGIPERMAFAAADRQLARGIAFVLAAAVLAIVAAWLIGDRLIARPVRKIVDTTKAVADGDLSARTRVPHDEGEIGQLARSFDVMASDLQQAYLGTVEVLADAVEARDPYTGGHVRRVCDYSLAIGRELGWSERQLLQLQMAAALHDVGKIGVPDAVLRKQGPLDDHELPVMRSHAKIGAELLHGVPFLYPAMQCAIGHQEFFDGKGYPQGLAGDDIPPEARVVAIADTFDAMTTDRPYRKGMAAEVAIAEIRRCAGTQFDPVMVEAFVRTIERRARAGRGDEVTK
jgi:HD-GYP domain-containing protein (c-di-GMP phosphodiesterase class II)